LWNAAEAEVDDPGNFRQIRPQKKTPPAPIAVLAGVEETLRRLCGLEGHLPAYLQCAAFVGASDLAEVRVTERRIDGVPLWMVESVDGVGTNLKVHAFAEAEGLG
jgi:hypothetical protein